MSEEIIIVDKDDNEISFKDRHHLDSNDIYRAAALWLTNSKGQILLARRGYNRSKHPGKWGPAVAGTVAKGETYDTNIVKEIKEEIDLENLKLTKGPKLFVNLDYLHFTQWYRATVDKEIKDFKIQKEEVAEIKWFSKKELEEQLKNNPEDFLPSTPNYFKALS